jgi:preprotein translocase subunit YajC
MMLNLWNLLAFQAPGGLRDWGGLVLPIGFLLIFYFIVWMPARRRQKSFQEMVEALKKGDRVVTTGGLYGEIVSVDSSTVILKIADAVKVKVAKSAIATLEGQEGDKGDNR